MSLKIYMSEKNIKKMNQIRLNYSKTLNSKYHDLPLLENDTNSIIVYKNEHESIKRKKKRKFWNLIYDQ